MSPAESTPKSNSTGPRTPEGKQRSSYNALRHGLTGRVVVLPGEDMEVYNAFCKELIADLAPETPTERQYAQTFCDTQWRLNRARSYEESMLALGHFEHADSLGIEHPEALAALTAAKTFREDSKAFVNLTLYEQRLQRTQKEALRQLHELQAKRIAARQAALDEAVAIRNLHKMKAQPYDPAATPTSDQFVFSTAEIELEARRQHLRADAQNARSHHYNLAGYNKSTLKQAA
jgi:predicted negative regulator of RcsB-dependent stress response